MRPKERRESGQKDLFKARLDQIVDLDHALVKLAGAVNWRFLEDRFGAVYDDDPGRPPLPTRLVLRVVGRVERLAPAWVHPMHGGSLPADVLPGYTAALRSLPFTFDGRLFGRQLPDGT
jgi:hypothetical protein